MIDVEVRNFQSIEHVLISIDGFTALVGKSDIGKSALVRAVKAALTGATGTAFVRHGVACLRRIRGAKTCDCYCSVHLRTEGFDLKWEKGDKRNLYTLNGKDYGVPNRGTPEFLERPSLERDFGMVKIGDQAQLLQIADQFDNVFLLNQTGGVVADVFSDVARLDSINGAMRLVERDRKDAVSTRKVRERDMTELTHQLNDYEGLDAAIKKVDSVEQTLGNITSTQGTVESLDGYIEELKALGFRVDSLQKACETALPRIDPVITTRGRYENLTRLHLEANEKATAIKSLLGVEQLSVPTITPTVEKAVHYGQVVTWVSKLCALQEQFGKFRGVVDSIVPDTTAIKVVRDRLAQVSEFTSRAYLLDKAIRSLEVDYAAVLTDEKVLGEEVKAFPFCPSCEQPLSVGHTHEERHVA